MDRRAFVKSATVASAFALTHTVIRSQEQTTTPTGIRVVQIQAHVEKRPLPHVWEGCIGSDRAVVGLRQQWLSDLELIKKTTGIQSVRFHGLFNDEMGVWPNGAKQPNFLYVDMVFDAMMERGVRPYVELSFMPGALASGAKTLLWYHGNTTPPKSPADWGDLVGQLGKHLVDRYGTKEVATWNFEVWNEPNIVFWSGTKADYFELYRQSATALKKVDEQLRVGGPSTAQAGWVADLLEFSASQQLPIDFVSTHVYPDDPQAKVFGEGVHYPVEEMIPKALALVRSQIKASKFPDTPLYMTEWSSQNPAFIAHTIHATTGLAEMLSYWTFDNVYEELGVPKSFLNSGFGLLGMRGVPRPSYYTFTLLHKLGDVEIESGDGPVLATRRKDGSLAILVWNLIPQAPGKRSSMGDPLVQTADNYENKGEALKLTLALNETPRHRKAHVTRVDEKSGNFRPAYEAMGSPAYPTTRQIDELKQKSEPTSEALSLSAEGHLTITIPPNGVALIELV